MTAKKHAGDDAGIPAHHLPLFAAQGSCGYGFSPVGVHHAGDDGACANVHEIRFLSGEPPCWGLCCMDNSLCVRLLATFNE